MTVPQLETERLVLRGWREEDLPAFADFCADTTTTRFIGATDRQDTWRRMAVNIGHWRLRGYGRWALEEKATRRWIDPANAPSMAVARRLGATYEREVEIRGSRVGQYRHPAPGALNRSS